MKQPRRLCLSLLVAASILVGIAIGRASTSWVLATEVQEPVPNLDFSLMAIATRPVETTESGGAAKVRVKAWERCALGYTTCGERGRLTVEAMCLGSRRIVLIDEKDWPAFQRTPDEDLPGIENAPPDMRLCATQDQ